MQFLRRWWGNGSPRCPLGRAEWWGCLGADQALLHHRDTAVGQGMQSAPGLSSVVLSGAHCQPQPCVLQEVTEAQHTPGWDIPEVSWAGTGPGLLSGSVDLSAEESLLCPMGCV